MNKLTVWMIVGCLASSVFAQAARDAQPEPTPAPADVADEQAADDEFVETDAFEDAPADDAEYDQPDDGPIVDDEPPMNLELSGAEVDVQVVGDKVLIRGVDSDLAILRALMERLDRDVTPPDYRVITLQNKNAQEVAQVVQDTMSNLKTTDEVPAHEQVNLATIANNIIIATGPGEKLDIVAAIVETIDQVDPVLPKLEKMEFQLEHVKAAEAATQLEEFIQVLQAQQKAEAAQEIKVFPISASNTLVVLAPVAERDKIQELVNTIDVEPAEGFGDLKLAYFPLLNSQASELADVLNELFETAETDEEAAEAIRRIRMIKTEPGPDGELVELPPINLERQIKLIPDEDSQAIICATAEENIPPLQELIALLDGVPLAVEQSLRIYQLQHADATSVKEMLDEMFESGKDLPKPAPGSESTEAVPQNAIGQALVYNVGITADARTNILVVTGRQEQLVLIDGILQKVDVPSTEVKHPLHLITLANVDATRVGKVIEGLWEQRIEAMQGVEVGEAQIAREQIFLSVDLRSNAIIVSATEANFEEIKLIAAQLDAMPDRFNDQIRLINCTHTSAGDLKSKIDELWQRKAELRGEAELPQDLPIVVADQRSNALVIASSPEDYEEIKRLVDQLEAQPLAPMAQIRLLTLKNNDADAIGQMLEELFDERLEQRLAEGQEENPSDRVAIAAEPATNTLLIASSPDNYKEIHDIVERLDIEPDLDGVVRIFTLANAQAETVVEKIDELFEAGLYTGNVVGDSEISERRENVALVADTRSNAVIASASPTNLSIIEKLISEMDTDRAPLLDADTRIYELAFADPVKIAGMLDTLFEGMAQLTEEFEAPTLVPDPISNTLIVTGSRDAIKRATDLVKSLDVERSKQTAVQVYALEYASAVKLAGKMQEIFDSRDEGVDTQRTPVLLMPDESTNTLIASASEEDQSMVRHLIGMLDVPSTISRQVEVFPLESAKAEPTAEALQGLFESQARTGGDQGEAMAVQADRRTNSLIVWAAQSEMRNIAEIVEKLDKASPGVEMKVKVIPLNRAVASELSETLLNTLTGGETGGGDDEQAVILVYDEELPDGTVVTRKLLRQDLTIEPDERTNALFVMAPAGSMEMLEGLVKSIDRIESRVSEIRLFPLANADAEEIVEKLTELWPEPTGGGATGDGPDTRLQFGGIGGAGGEAVAPGQELRFTADRRTNTVIAAGVESDLNMVEGLIRNLDAQDQDERMRFVYEARYVPAPDLATALRDYFTEEDDVLGELDDEESIARRAERSVTVVGDEKSNSLLLGVSPRYFSRTMEMLYSMDRPPAQVSIEVLIAEVSLDDSLEFGMEWALQDLSFSRNATVGPNGIVSGNGHDFVGGTDVGASGAAGSFGGFTFSITSQDFGFLVRALQSDGSLRVLSRPQITVENNSDANIKIGDRVPFLQNSSVTDSGQVNSSVGYEDVGIQLEVTPHINPDNYVNLEVRQEISALNAGTVQISEALSAPTVTNRVAETVVTVKDGETVVIGGLIQTQESENETKVPIFGDLPYIGNFFRATSTSRRRTEQLIVLTVNVIRNERDFRRESIKLREASGFMPKEMKRSPLMQGLRILPEDDLNGRSPSDTKTTPVRIRTYDRSEEYGPTPETYGPQPPDRDEVSPANVQETYGPPVPGTELEPVAYQAAGRARKR